MQVPRFTIRFIKQVIFRTEKGEVLKVYNVGDTEQATGREDVYFIIPMGGIYPDEAVKV